MPYSTPTLSGSIPNPATAPLTGDLSWTVSTTPGGNDGSLLLHFDGTNGSTTFLDTSGVGNIMTVYNAAVTVSTAAPEFGTGCGDFVASAGGYLHTPLTPGGPLDLGAGGDWTIEMWLKFGTQAAAGGVAHVVEIGGFAQEPHNYTLYIVNGVGGAISFSAPGGTTSSTAYTANTWFALAVVNHGNTVQMYINGSAVGTPFTLSPSSNGGGNVTIGGQYGTSNDPFNGFVDELRISQVARYTSNYTPATSPFPDGGGTINASGYDIYRNGVSIAQVGAVLSYIDNVPSAGTYTYNVAAYVGGVDASPESNTVSLTYAESVVGFPHTIFDEAIFGAYFGGQLNLVEFTYMPGRTPFEEGATNLIINRYKQEPADVRQRGVDFTQFAVPGEILTGVTVTGISAQGVPQAQTSPLVTPLVITNVVIDPVTQLKFAYSVSGGQNGIEYTVQFTTTTSIQTATLEEIFSVNIMIEDAFP